ERSEYRPPRRDDRPRSYDGQRRDRRDRNEDRPPRRDYRSSDGDRPRSYDGQRRDGGERSGYRPQNRDDRPRSYDGQRRDRRDRNEDRPPRRDYSSRDDRGYRDRGDRSERSYDRRSGGYPDRERNGGYSRDRGDGDRYREREDEKPRGRVTVDDSNFRLPRDPSKMLYNGIDCQENGDLRTAMILYLHGSVLMSGGCAKNAARIIHDLDPVQMASMRKSVAPRCSNEALIEFDYLCISESKGYDRQAFDAAVAEHNPHALYRRICLGEMEADSEEVDEFASHYGEMPEKVRSGLDILRRKSGSDKAAEHLNRFREFEDLRRSLDNTFVRAMKGSEKARAEIEKHSGDVREAEFYNGYLKSLETGDGVDWLRTNFETYNDLIIAKQALLDVRDAPYSRYLYAKNLQAKKEEWIPAMTSAAASGSPEALDELNVLSYRPDVAKSLARIYAQNDDLDGIMSMYKAGMRDEELLDEYCGGDPEKIIAMGSAIGKISAIEEIYWLSRHARVGSEECKIRIKELSNDPFYRKKAMLYALHDIGDDMEAARLYFAMGDSPEVPSYKWLKKVCTDEEVTSYVREQYESKGDLATFESIFADDGYEKRPQGRPGQRGAPRGRGYDRRRR
ncbi:MAG: hypothetical protein IJ856_05085, partial [Candidatus Methanomethylophilaceae archaeon]|nr:hypothetical protein [Candidatus Methanomethylophilaceae archaeon]